MNGPSTSDSVWIQRKRGDRQESLAVQIQTGVRRCRRRKKVKAVSSFLVSTADWMMKVMERNRRLIKGRKGYLGSLVFTFGTDERNGEKQTSISHSQVSQVS